MTLKDEAEWLIYLYRYRLISLKDVVAWADRHIEKLDEPPYELIEISMHPENFTDDFVRLLERYPGPLDRDAARAAFFVSLHERLATRSEEIQTVARILFRMAIDGEIASPADVQKIYWFDDAVDLVIDGQVASPSLSEIRQEILSFLEAQGRPTRR